MKREFLQLAERYKKERDGIAGWWASEKIDGMRGFWDGGISRGFKKSEVPWANTRKDARYLNEPIATGLWSRYGNVIHAPDWWLDTLPKIPLDGELDTGNRQQTMAIVKDLIPGPGWESVKYRVFDSPPLATIFANGKISNPNFDIFISWEKCEAFIKQGNKLDGSVRSETVLDSIYFMFYHKWAISSGVVIIHQQIQLPYTTEAAEKKVTELLNDVLKHGGEGLVVRNPYMNYVCERSKGILKIKPFDDEEAVVIGYTSGRETTLGSKLLGKIGALIVDWKGKIFELSGLTDYERTLSNPEWAINNPGQRCPDHIDGIVIPKGSVVTFRYRGLTNDGIPQEARFQFIREKE